MNWIKSGSIIFVITLSLWIAIDFTFTKIIGVTGFSQFFIHHEKVGRLNKPGSKGVFGGPLEDFLSNVSIGVHSERNSSVAKCDLIKQRIIYIGDSTTAGFEVNDAETFVSIINQSCTSHFSSGLNFGVRAHDTHMVSALYKMIKKTVPHQTVFYLISGNDFQENLDLFAYPSLTAKFGRFFEGRLIHPISEGWLDILYLSARVFIGNNFYLTTRLLVNLERFSQHLNTQHKASNDSATKNLKLSRLHKMKELLNNLALEAVNENAELYVAIYPSLHEDWEASDERIYEENLTKWYGNFSNIKMLELGRFIEEKDRLGCLKKSDMKFTNDGHLSKFGHKVISDFLRVELLNDQSLSLASICYK